MRRASRRASRAATESANCEQRRFAGGRAIDLAEVAFDDGADTMGTGVEIGHVAACPAGTNVDLTGEAGGRHR